MTLYMRGQRQITLNFKWIFYDLIHAGAGEDNSDRVNFEHHRKL